MQTISPGSVVRAAPSALRLAGVFVLLFVFYQLPEGLGLRTLQSIPATLVLWLLFMLVAWQCGRMLGFRGFDAWYMARPRWALLLAACFGLAVLAKALALGAGSAAGIYQVQIVHGVAGQAWLAAAIIALAYTVLPSIAEDIVTRGFLMRALPALGRRPVFIVASALLYVLNHIYRLADGPLEWLMLFCFGLAYAAALYYSGSLWAAIGLHWGWNFAGKFADQVATIDALPGQGPLVSSAAHLVLLGVLAQFARQLRRMRAAS
jgi:membrane protease YdiL (CAAX protease family)